MFTDEGFKYLIGVPGAALSIAYAAFGEKLDSIVNLTPTATIESLQGKEIVSSTDKYDINGSYGSLSVLKFAGGLTHRHDLAFYLTGYGTTAPKHWEMGIFGNNGKLLYYRVYVNHNKTLAYPNNYTSGYAHYEIDINIPTDVVSKETSLILGTVTTTFKVNYEPVTPRTLTDMTMVTRKDFTVQLLNSDNSRIKEGTCTLESYDVTAKTALYHLTISIDESIKSSTNYLYLATIFGCFKITIHDSLTSELKDWPVTAGESLVLPVEFKLGDL